MTSLPRRFQGPCQVSDIIIMSLRFQRESLLIKPLFRESDHENQTVLSGLPTATLPLASKEEEDQGLGVSFER